MSMDETDEKNVVPETPEVKPGAREQYLSRMRERMGEDTDWEGDPEGRYGAFLKYDDEREGELKGYKDSNQKLGDMFGKNPQFAAMMNDMMKGEDATTAFIKYFGRDALDAAGDEEKMQMIAGANQEYLNRVSESEELRKRQEQNLQASEADLSAFQSEQGMDDEAFAKFLDAVYGVVEQGLEGRIGRDFLEVFWKGLNYEKDVQDAATTGEIEGRNQKIALENRTQKGDAVPNLSGANLSRDGKREEAPRPKKRDFFEEFPQE